MRWLLETTVRVQHLNHTAATASTPPGTASATTRVVGSQPPSPPPPTNDSFDANMVIILAALLCALILALGLNSILRCALRCSTTTSTTASKPPRGGLKKGALRKLPVAVYGTEAAFGIAATECPICLGDFEGGEQVRALPGCGHGFHARCVDAWLVSNSSCPTCRRSLLAPARDAKPQLAPAAEPEPRMGYRVRAFFMPTVIISPPPPPPPIAF